MRLSIPRMNFDRKSKFCKFKIADGRHIENRFYRATLCVNAVFAVAQCLSVYLFVVTLGDCIQTAEGFVALLSWPGRYNALDFFDQMPLYQIPKELLQRGQKIQGVGKYCDFLMKSPSISETV